MSDYRLFLQCIGSFLKIGHQPELVARDVIILQKWNEGVSQTSGRHGAALAEGLGPSRPMLSTTAAVLLIAHTVLLILDRKGEANGEGMSPYCENCTHRGVRHVLK